MKVYAAALTPKCPSCRWHLHFKVHRWHGRRDEWIGVCPNPNCKMGEVPPLNDAQFRATLSEAGKVLYDATNWGEVA